ncbi:HNH endonuclease signature motif containing protein [Klebsiella variicola]|uniref:HNH endonuclease signature motif containing protein n=1 Tax=Klebsiella variicola TaxID=244366 RepID=UPI003CFF6D74
MAATNLKKTEIDYMTEEQKLARWPNALKLKREIERRREEEFKGKFPKWVSKKILPYGHGIYKTGNKPAYANTSKRLDLSDFNKIEIIDDEIYQLIPATGELVLCKVSTPEDQNVYPSLGLQPLIGFNKKRLPAHRVVAAYYNDGVIPEGMVVDHRNGNRQDYRIDNLRIITHEMNMKNLPADRLLSKTTNGIEGNF